MIKIETKTRAKDLSLIGVLTSRLAKGHPSKLYFLEGWFNPQSSHHSANPTKDGRCGILGKLGTLSKLPLTIAMDGF